MTTEMITIEVDPETARAFRDADQQRRAKLAILIRWGLDEMKGTGKSTLFEITDEIGRKAQAGGLTPDILQSILDSEDGE